MRNNESYERMVQTLKRNVALKRTLQKMHLKYACLKEHIPFEPCDLSFEWITILCASPLFNSRTDAQLFVISSQTSVVAHHDQFVLM